MTNVSNVPIPEKMLEDSGLVTIVWSRFFSNLVEALKEADSAYALLHSSGGDSVGGIGSEPLSKEETFNLVATLGTL